MIRIQTLGGLTVRAEDGSPVPGSAAQPRRMAILALLARAGERGITREKVLTLLWPDADDERGSRALAQACYALRRDLGGEDAITGSKELRLNPALVSTDVGEFAAAVARGEDELAASVYAGPFLDGFRLPGADEFSRWVETERTSLAHDYARILESLARAAQVRGQPQDAVTWWRKLAALEPLNARVAIGLMEAMSAAGDRAGAILHAHVYDLLVQEELDLPPDKEVTALAERLRSQAAASQPPALPAPVPPLAAAREREEHSALVGEPVAVAPQQSVRAETPRSTRRRPRAWLLAGAAGFVLLAALLSNALRKPSGVQGKAADRVAPVVAIGRIVSYGSDSATVSLTGAVADLLATSLARVPNLRLVSSSRMLELSRSADTSAAAQVSAARTAGATEVIDGVLYSRAGGLLRLDLRRVDLVSGAIRDVRTVEGHDLFALVDSGTAQLGGGLGGNPPRGSIADVTTRSETAYRMYAEGMRAYYAGDFRTALKLFDSALQVDSTFALAAYYGAIAAGTADPTTWRARFDTARKLAAHAADRERLIITANWAYRMSSPILGAVADTLAVRYPGELQADLFTGIARVMAGDFVTAIAPLERVVRIDSMGLRGAVANCAACEAVVWLVSAYEYADSSVAAERAARRWLRLQPSSWPAAQMLMGVLQVQGRVADAEAIMRANVPADAPYDLVLIQRVTTRLHSYDYASADQILHEDLRHANPHQATELFWWLAVSLREQGRLSEALETARQLRRFPDAGRAPGLIQSGGVLESQILLESGDARRAAAAFDSIAHITSAAPTPSERARHLAFTLTHVADAYAQSGDTAQLARLADSIFGLGQQSGFGRDSRLFHHVRGLLLRARGRDVEAINEFRSAIYAPTFGYTRTNLQLAQLYLRNRRPRDAVAVLQPALRGPLDGSNLYVNRTELQELLARAWDEAGARDSARVHYQVVAKAWSAGDTSFRIRAEHARARAAALTAH